LSGWFQIQKRIQNLFENGYGKLEKKKKRKKILFGFLAQFSPQPAAHRPFALLSLTRGPFFSFSRAWPVSLPSPRPALGRA
jgi:hypothetical protein